MGQICSVSLGEKVQAGSGPTKLEVRSDPAEPDLKIVQVASDEAPKPVAFPQIWCQIEGVERIREGRIPPTWKNLDLPRFDLVFYCAWSSCMRHAFCRWSSVKTFHYTTIKLWNYANTFSNYPLLVWKIHWHLHCVCLHFLAPRKACRNGDLVSLKRSLEEVESGRFRVLSKRFLDFW